METGDFILDILDRMQGAMKEAVDSLTHEELTWRPGAEANSIGFLLWHKARAEDILVQAMIQQKPEVWVSDKWYQKLNLPEDSGDGYGYTAERVAAFPVPELDDLLGYAAAVRAKTVECLKGMTPDKFDEVVKRPFFGELSISQFFAITLSEITQHIGQIAYLRGLQRGLNK